MRTTRFFPDLMLVMALMCIGFSVPLLAAEGGLRLSQTRVVFEGSSNSTKVTLTNNSDQVYLIKGDVMNTPEGNAQLPAPPFMITPPLSRLEAQSQNTSLVIRNGTVALPTDRESVFYLSLLAIPSTPKGINAEENMTNAQVSVGIRNVIKLFYRPAKLPMNAEQAANKLTFRQVGQQLEISNPTPYYLTLAELKTDSQVVDVRNVDAMIAPFSMNHYPATGKVSQVEWRVITDFGGAGPTYHAKVQTGAEHANPETAD